MKLLATFGRIFWFLFGLGVVVAIILGYFGSSIVRDSMLGVLALSGIFYFEWVLGEISGRIEELKEASRDIQKKMGKLDGLSFEIEAIARFVRAEEDKQLLAEFDAESNNGTES